MKLNNKTYDRLKFVVTIFLPALITLITTLGSAFAWELTQLIVVTLGAITTFLGTLLGISTNNYNKELKT
ncbi:hypothetical protein M2139_001624 [Enterococcus sp. PF1-24]|uniref:phage holin n=1 Tax=unclassified Enterococcus TaxID=2608891 RepID=UPI002475DD32|nr:MULTISPECIES: phage holin [unclassified Enterococcus]MDH6364637.1 hypothetical protein [Enterococcus sp. PFB1-1]MDH6401738.1 hypothetical protein [Enterococcus sp. PF1-24]